MVSVGENVKAVHANDVERRTKHLEMCLDTVRKGI